MPQHIFISIEKLENVGQDKKGGIITYLSVDLTKSGHNTCFLYYFIFF